MRLTATGERAAPPGLMPAMPRATSGSAFDAFRPIAPLIFLIYACLLSPPELAFVVGGLKVTGYRLAIAIFIIPALAQYSRRTMKFHSVDALVWIGNLWILVAFVNHFDPGVGLLRGTSIIVDTLGPYLIARTSIRNHDDLRRLLIAISPAFFGVGMIMAIESVTHRGLLRPALASVFGAPTVYAEGVAIGTMSGYGGEVRMGLMRSVASFSHPILGGAILASLLPLYFYSGLRSWPLYMGLTASACAIFSVSSAVLLMLLIGVGLIVTDWAKNYVRLVSWPLIVGAIACVMLSLHFLSDSGLIKVIVRYTFSPWNGYVRIFQWEAGFEALRNSPYIGIAYQRPPLPAWMPGSIDSHFLVLALRSGWITSLSIYGAIVMIIVQLGLGAHRLMPDERGIVVGYIFSISLLLLASFTVMFFSESNLLFMIIVGIGGALVQDMRTRFAMRRALPNQPHRPDISPAR